MIIIDAQKKEITLAIAARIKLYRHKKGFSQEELALQASLNPAYYGQVERGEKCPTIDTVHKISTALGISLSELVRFDSAANSREEDCYRLKELLANVPAEKMEQVLKIIEDVIGII